MNKAICTFILSLIVFSAFSQDKRPVIAFTSDTQEPMWVEKIMLKSNHNRQATKMIFKDVLTLHPSGFFILGDVVSVGYRVSKWTAIDECLKQFAHDTIPVYATLGNHEVLFREKKGD